MLMIFELLRRWCHVLLIAVADAALPANATSRNTT
jgi:hypothetical protein